MNKLLVNTLERVDGVNFIDTVDFPVRGLTLTRYKINGGHILYTDGNSYIKLDTDELYYHIEVDGYINDFVTVMESELFDVLAFMSI